jgi:hypothetical protein
MKKFLRKSFAVLSIGFFVFFFALGINITIMPLIYEKFETALMMSFISSSLATIFFLIAVSIDIEVVDVNEELIDQPVKDKK